jgi:hypothetical protein
MADSTLPSLSSEWQSHSYSEAIKLAQETYGVGQFGIVYRIYCQQSGVSYVRQTADLTLNKRGIPGRILSHHNALKRNLHPCQPLQAAWNASNGASIKDELLEVVAIKPRRFTGKKQIREREQYWQQQLDANQEPPVEKAYYPCTAIEMRQLRDAGIINNTTFIYFALKLEHPWSDRPIRIHPTEFAVRWDLPESSVYEAIARLKDADLIQIEQAEIEIQWVHSQQGSLSENPESFLESQNGFRNLRMTSEKSESPPLPNSPHSKGFKNSEVSANVPIVLNKLVKTTKHPPSHPVKIFNREKNGANDLLELIKNAGVIPNKSIRATLYEVLNRLELPAATRAVENAISAFQEQQAQGTIRNPGGFLNSALRRGFTANQAKKTARSQPVKPTPPDLTLVAIAIDQALRVGDLTFALAKLQTLWAEGWHEELRELCYLRKDWGFRITDSGIEEKAVTGNAAS